MNKFRAHGALAEMHHGTLRAGGARGCGATVVKHKIKFMNIVNWDARHPGPNFR